MPDSRDSVYGLSTDGRYVREQGRTSERLASLRRVDLLFVWDSTQIDVTLWGQADRIEIGFRSPQADHMRDGMVMISARVVHLSHCGVGRKSLVCE